MLAPHRRPDKRAERLAGQRQQVPLTGRGPPRIRHSACRIRLGWTQPVRRRMNLRDQTALMRLRASLTAPPGRRSMIALSRGASATRRQAERR